MDPVINVIKSAQQMLQKMPDPMYIIDLDNNVLWVNDSFQKLFGSEQKRWDDELIHLIFHVKIENAPCIVYSKDGLTITVNLKLIPINEHDSTAIAYTGILQKSTIEQLFNENIRYKIVADNTSDVIVLVDNRAVVRYVSPSIHEIIGYTVEQYEGMDAFHIIHHEDRERVRSLHLEVIQTKTEVDLEYRLIHSRGTTLYVETRVKPVLDSFGNVKYVVAVVRDITSRIMDSNEQKRSELALEESEQRYKSLFENNLDGVFSIDLKAYFVNANHSFEKITGIKIDDLPDRCLIGLIYDEDHLSIYQVLSEVIATHESRDLECRIVRFRQRDPRIVHITFVPIFLNGELIGVHGMVKDITERKNEELELIQSEERYKTLQHSITHFSHDLANVMKVSELEMRLMEEIMRVLPVKSVTIEEVPRNLESTLSGVNVKWVKIADKELPVYLKIDIDQALQKIEEEWLETAVHYVTILYDNLEFIENLMKRIEDMVSFNETPKWMLRLLFRLSEKERASLSSDLHDSVLQDLIIWYRKLESLRSTSILNEGIQEEIMQVEEGLLDAIHQIRITCNELRPPFLLKMGLVESLKSLFSYARMFSNYEIDFTATELIHPLNEDQILGMYRIVQELLNNATKHSNASKVTMNLTSTQESIQFSYTDNGVGIDLTSFDGSYKHMGLAGIENRVLSLEGKVEFHSAPYEGFHMEITIPTITTQKGDHYGNFIGG
ncbi:sensor histidine kinase [Neobacillus drentensis]|uniref:sensor histidine kinase n=1 Tax=Neobacillus drentensis TaxID=220684 RepID=UPI003001C501